MYIDPNTGGMLFQILAVMFGVISASLLFFSSRIRVAWAKFRRQMRERNAPQAENVTSDDETQPPAA
jgi:hypothetical protein